jgi:maltooligosyltrehalose trehalohydrolase
VTEGRRNEFARFERFSSPNTRASIPDPNAEITFTICKLDWKSLDEPSHQSWLGFYHDLLALRRNTIVPHLRNISGRSSTFTVGQSNSLAVDWKLANKVTLRLIANLGSNSVTPPAAPAGRLIYSTVEDIPEKLNNGTMPPWSVAWFLHR